MSYFHSSDQSEDDLNSLKLIGLCCIGLAGAAFMMSRTDSDYYSNYRIVEGNESKISKAAKIALVRENIDSEKLLRIPGFLKKDTFRSEHDPNGNGIFKLYVGDRSEKDEPYIYIAVDGENREMLEKFNLANLKYVTVTGRLEPWPIDRTVHIYCKRDCDIEY